MHHVQTLQVTSFLAGTMMLGKISTSLVLTPKSVIPSWEREINNNLKVFLSEVNITVIDASMKKKQRSLLLSQIENSTGQDKHIIIMSHHLLLTMIDEVSRIIWDSVVLDEGHIIKNTTTKMSQTMHLLRSPFRLLLSGTPIQNDLREFWALVNWATQGSRFGREADFRKSFADPILRGQDPNANAKVRQLAADARVQMIRAIRPILLRRKKADQRQKELQLPEKKELVLWIRLSTKQRQKYFEYVNSKRFEEAMRQTTYPVEVINTLKTICRHPTLLKSEDNRDIDELEASFQRIALQNSAACDNFPTPQEVGYGKGHIFDIIGRVPSKDELLAESTKLRVLARMTSRLLREDHRVLIFSQSKRMLELIQYIFVEYGYPTFKIDGSTPSEERQYIIDQFNTLSAEYSGPKICLLTTKACGVGINLIGADRVIIFDPSWNPAEDSQAVDRAYRIGQTKPVIVYRLIHASCVEEKVYQKQVFKEGLRVISEKGHETKRYFAEKSQLRELLALGGKDAVDILRQMPNKMDLLQLDNLFGMDSVIGCTRHDRLYKEDQQPVGSMGNASESFKTNCSMVVRENHCPDTNRIVNKTGGDDDEDQEFDCNDSHQSKKKIFDERSDIFQLNNEGRQHPQSSTSTSKSIEPTFIDLTGNESNTNAPNTSQSRMQNMEDELENEKRINKKSSKKKRIVFDDDDEIDIIPPADSAVETEKISAQIGNCKDLTDLLFASCESVIDIEAKCLTEDVFLDNIIIDEDSVATIEIRNIGIEDDAASNVKNESDREPCSESPYSQDNVETRLCCSQENLCPGTESEQDDGNSFCEQKAQKHILSEIQSNNDNFTISAANEANYTEGSDSKDPYDVDYPSEDDDCDDDDDFNLVIAAYNGSQHAALSNTSTHGTVHNESIEVGDSDSVPNKFVSLVSMRELRHLRQVSAFESDVSSINGTDTKECQFSQASVVDTVADNDIVGSTFGESNIQDTQEIDSSESIQGSQCMFNPSDNTNVQATILHQYCSMSIFSPASNNSSIILDALPSEEPAPVRECLLTERHTDGEMNSMNPNLEKLSLKDTPKKENVSLFREYPVTENTEHFQQSLRNQKRQMLYQKIVHSHEIVERNGSIHGSVLRTPVRAFGTSVAVPNSGYLSRIKIIGSSSKQPLLQRNSTTSCLKPARTPAFQNGFVDSTFMDDDSGISEETNPCTESKLIATKQFSDKENALNGTEVNNRARAISEENVCELESELALIVEATREHAEEEEQRQYDEEFDRQLQEDLSVDGIVDQLTSCRITDIMKERSRSPLFENVKVFTVQRALLFDDVDNE